MINVDGGGASEPLEQLSLIKLKGERAVLALYPLLEKYLVILRKQLEPALFQSIFHLVTQHQPESFNQLAEQQRLRLRQRLRWLCNKCSAFLTIEQLLELAIKLQSQDQEPQQIDEVQPESLQPPGSISLSLNLPPLMEGFNPTNFSQHNNHLDINYVSAFQALKQMLSSASLNRYTQLRKSFPMPQDPLVLQCWLAAWDFALTRRLRNLSIAVNVELFRIGLSKNSLPIALLDAVLEGGADVLTAPPNQLAIKVANPLGGSSEFALHGVLVRCTDMEYVHPALRSIRVRINQINANLLRMARRAQHWEQQLAIRKAEQHWINDSRQDHLPKP